MERRRLKFVLLGLGVAATMVFLIAVGVGKPGGFVYYVTVSEFNAGGATRDGNVRVNGKVAEGTIRRLPSGQDVSFTMTDGQATLPVAYSGIIPDTFVDGADVVVEGALRTDGTFEATTLLAKCPSKYEAADTSTAKAAE